MLEDRVTELENKVKFLEGYLNLLSAHVLKDNDIQKQKRPSYKKYVVIANDEESIASIVFALGDICKISTNDRPNVSYVRIDGVNNIDIVVITQSFFREWKNTHYKFYTCSYEDLIANFRKDGVINAEG